jgi:hypothetical protein
MTSKIVDKYLANIEASMQREAIENGFNPAAYTKELETILKKHYTDITNIKLNVMRVVSGMESRLDEDSLKKLENIGKMLDKVTNPLELLLASVMGVPTANI